jgi:hypothetical protein
MKIQTSLLFLVSIFVLFSCTPSELTRDEYIKFIEDESNGLKVSEAIGEFVFIVQYKPADYMALLEQRTAEIDKVQFLKTKEELSNLEQFNITIESKSGKAEMLKTDIRNDQEYFRRIEYFTMEAEKDFKLITGYDTVSCGLYHFERSYDITPYSKIVLGFEKKISESKEDRLISFNESILGIGNINFRIKNKDIKNIPQLVLQK